MNPLHQTILLAVIPAFLAGQIIPPQNQFAGFKLPDEGHSLRRELENPAVAVIPGSSGEAYAFEASTGKLFRLDYAAFRLTEINVSLKIGGGRVYSLAVDKDGAIYLPDAENSRVLRILPDGTATIFTGNGVTGRTGDGGLATQASLDTPRSTALDPAGNLYIGESDYVRKVDLQGRISRFAGCLEPCAAGPLGINRRVRPRGLATDRRGNLYLTTSGDNPLLVLNPAGVTVAIRQVQDPARPGVPEKFASQSWGSLTGLVVAPDGALFIADAVRHVIWKIGTNGYWSVAVGRAVVAGAGGREYIPGDYYGNGPLTGKEHFDTPISIALDSAGRLLIGDDGNRAIRLFTPNDSLVTVAGQRRCCYREELIPANEATIEWPRGLASDSKGNIYIADPRSGRVRKIDSFGIISTVLGNGSLDARVGVQGTDTGAQPYSVAVDSKGNLYVAEPGLRMVRRVTPDGFVESVAGPQSGTFPLTLPTFPGSQVVAVGPDDAVYYLTECSVNRWLAGKTEVVVANACIFVRATARDEKPTVLAVGRDGTIYVATGEYQRIRAYRNGQFQTLPDVFPFGNLAFPYALHYGKDDLLYVTDAFGGAQSLTGTYYLAYALTAGARQLAISYTYYLNTFKEIAPGILELVGSIEKAEPFATGYLLGITTDSGGRVIVGHRSPPGLLIYPKVQAGN